MFSIFLSLWVLCIMCVGAQTVSYEVGVYTSSCAQVCSAANLLCADSMVEKMSCSAVAAAHCQSKTMAVNSNIGCTVSGCYVNCAHNYYYSKTSAYSSCNTGGTCLTSSANLYKACPCYAVTSSELEGWATVGLYLAGAIVIGGVALLVRALMNKKNSGHQPLSTSSSDSDVEAGGGVMASLVGVFSGGSGKDQEVEEGGGRKKNKKTKTKFKTKLPLDDDLDDTRDMAVK